MQGWGEAAPLKQHASYIGHVARHNGMWPAITLRAWGPAEDQTATWLSGCAARACTETPQPNIDYATMSRSVGAGVSSTTRGGLRRPSTATLGDDQRCVCCGLHGRAERDMRSNSLQYNRRDVVRACLMKARGSRLLSSHTMARTRASPQPVEENGARFDLVVRLVLVSAHFLARPRRGGIAELGV